MRQNEAAPLCLVRAARAVTRRTARAVVAAVKATVVLLARKQARLP